MSAVSNVAPSNPAPLTMSVPNVGTTNVVIIERPGLDPEKKVVVDQPRKTTKYLSKYERARLLGTRAAKISHGAEIKLDFSKMPPKERAKYTDPLVIASKELEEKILPLGIRRFLPDGSHEDWFLDQLVIDL